MYSRIIENLGSAGVSRCLQRIALAAALLCLPAVEASFAQSPTDIAREISERNSTDTALPDDGRSGVEHLRRRDHAPSRQIELDIDPRLPSNFQGCQGCGSKGCQPPSPSPGTATSAGLIGQILAVIAILAALLMLARWLIRRGTFVRSEEEENELVTMARAQGADSLDNAISASNWNQAVHALWLSTILAIVEKGHRIPKAWTARQISQGLPFEGGVQGDLDRLRHLAELAAFAHHTSTEGEFQEAKRLADAIALRLPVAPEDTL